jgi:hypothetical protein
MIDDRPGDHPFPFAELNAKSPLLHTLSAGTVIFRMHPGAHGALYFGKKGHYRFDAPDGSFGVMYTGEDPECCFIESFGQTTGTPAVSGAYIEQRHLSQLRLEKGLRFIDLVETAGLARLGADGRLFTGSYAVSQAWSAALKTHPTKPDGIRYRSRRDPARVAYAVYECPASNFNLSDQGSLMDPKNRRVLDTLLDLYQVELIDP